jgi:hypothetical protein
MPLIAKQKERSMSPQKATAITLKMQGLTYEEVAERMNCTPANVSQLCRPSKNIAWELKRKAKFRCQHCNTPIRTGHVHHIDYNVSIEIFNSISNLLYLCDACHSKLHWEGEKGVKWNKQERIRWNEQRVRKAKQLYYVNNHY